MKSFLLFASLVLTIIFFAALPNILGFSRGVYDWTDDEAMEIISSLKCECGTELHPVDELWLSGYYKGEYLSITGIPMWGYGYYVVRGKAIPLRYNRMIEDQCEKSCQ